MANLALKAVMWGADKIPDSVFESVPGGFYKSRDRDGRNRRSDDRRHSRDRYSHDESDGRRRHRQHRDSSRKRRSDGHKRHRSQSKRRSDLDSDDDLSDPPQRPRSESRHRRRRGGDNDDDDDRYGYTNGHDGRRRRDSRYHGATSRPPYPDSNVEPRPYDQNAFVPGGKAAAAAATAGAAAAATATAPQMNHDALQSSQSEEQGNKGFTQRYIPYSDIYSQAYPDPPRGGSTSSEQPMSPVARPPYPQNPYAQDAPVGTQQPSYVVPNEDYDPRNDPHYYNPSVHDDRYTEYASRPGSAYSRSPSPSRRSRAYSPSYASYDSRHDRDHRRTRSERRSDTKTGRSKSKSRVREAFDPSQRGLGYTAVGALGGALVGSEVGKGPLPALIGALIGGAGTNAFQARERRKEAKGNDPDPRYERSDRRSARPSRAQSIGYYSD